MTVFAKLTEFEKKVDNRFRFLNFFSPAVRKWVIRLIVFWLVVGFTPVAAAAAFVYYSLF